MTGKIVRLVQDKGFGFIRDESGVDRFFHKTGLQHSSRPWDELRVGQSVQHLTPIDGPKGPRAIEVLAQ